MREKGQTEVAKTLETPVFSRGIEILTEKIEFLLRLRKYALKVIAQILIHTLKPDALFPGLIMR